MFWCHVKHTSLAEQSHGEMQCLPNFLLIFCKNTIAQRSVFSVLQAINTEKSTWDWPNFPPHTNALCRRISAHLFDASGSLLLRFCSVIPLLVSLPLKTHRSHSTWILATFNPVWVNLSQFCEPNTMNNIVTKNNVSSVHGSATWLEKVQTLDFYSALCTVQSFVVHDNYYATTFPNLLVVALQCAGMWRALLISKRCGLVLLCCWWL